MSDKTDNSDPPKQKLRCWISLGILLLGFTVALTTPIEFTLYASDYDDVENVSTVVMQGNTFVSSSPHFLEKKEVIPDYADVKLAKIGKCESNNNCQVCNRSYGCRSGMGKYGFITSTWNNTIDRMTCTGKYDTPKCIPSYLPDECGKYVYYWEQDQIPEVKRDHPVFDAKCSHIVARWLLLADGDVHWAQSRHCWGKFVLAK